MSQHHSSLTKLHVDTYQTSLHDFNVIAHLNNMVHPVVVSLSDVDSYRLECEAISLLAPLNDERAGDHGAARAVQWTNFYSTSTARGTVMDTYT